ncbi:MFS transporter [Actinokineospora cianjurensis]|uniref:Fucose permease n=1 Tax=Actinokineospora cianjurensis TaxID=585224 RepID=A0A421BBM9_9PSEU|nr:MFS transporter [Actinokineospora cianjurensis]RLK61774.1 fucose permease [Actinokineospora cianjurensis]
MRRPLWTRSGATLPSGFAAFLALGASAAAWGAALPWLRVRYDLGTGGGEEVISAYNLGALVAILTCGLLSRRLRPRPVLAGALIALGGGLTAAALAPTWGFLLVSAVVGGVGFGGSVLVLNTGYAAGPRGVVMVNLVNAVFGVGAIAAPLLVAEWDLPAVLAAIACAAVVALPVVAGPVGAHTPTPPVDRATVVAIAPFAVIGFLYAGVETSAGAWVSTHLTWTGTDPAAAARMTALFWAGLAVGRLLIPLVARGPEVIVPASFLLATAGLVIAVNPTLAPVGYTLTGLGLAPIIPTALVWLARITPHAHLAGSALLTSSMLGNVIHPALVGTVTTRDHPATIPLAITTYATLGVLAALWTSRHRPIPSAT